MSSGEIFLLALDNEKFRLIDINIYLIIDNLLNLEELIRFYNLHTITDFNIIGAALFLFVDYYKFTDYIPLEQTLTFIKQSKFNP